MNTSSSQHQIVGSGKLTGMQMESVYQKVVRFNYLFELSIMIMSRVFLFASNEMGKETSDSIV